MKASELRVGNWVNNNEEDYQITSATIAQIERGDATATPIEINEHWLSILGFRQESIDFWYRYSGDELIIIFDTDDNRIKICDTWKFPKRKYVHELQNLFYGITQLEL